MQIITFFGSDAMLLSAAKEVRAQVFHEEQGIDRKLDFDGGDETALHALALDGSEPIGTVRLEIKGTEGKLGRLCVLKAYRGTGIGSILTGSIEAKAKKEGLKRITLHSQLHAKEFYLKLGYETDGGVFEEAGIPHIGMKKRL